MEESFLESIKDRCIGKFPGHELELLRKLYKWIADTLCSMFVNNTYDNTH